MRKMSIIRLDNRGQISAEYLLLFVVILVVFLFMINNVIGPAVDASNNVTAVSDTKVVVQSIADAVNVVYANGPGAKRTLNVNIPHNMDLTFDTTTHTMWTNVNLSSATVTNMKNVNATMDYTGNINPSPLTINKGWHNITVYWNSESNRMEFTVNPWNTSNSIICTTDTGDPNENIC